MSFINCIFGRALTHFVRIKLMLQLIEAIDSRTRKKAELSVDAIKDCLGLV